MTKYHMQTVKEQSDQGLFVCVEVLQPSQLYKVMLSMVSLPNNIFTGQA